MAQQCFQNEYFDSLLGVCKPCHLRCSNSPPLPCLQHCSAVKGMNGILWTCLGLSLIVSVTVLVLMFLLRKRRFKSPQDKTKNTGPAPQHLVKAALEQGGVRAKTPPPRGRLEYTMEECSCDDCAPGESWADPETLFPLPVMEEGSTVPASVKAIAAEAPGHREVAFY